MVRTTTESVTTADDLSKGDEITVSGPDFLPKSNLTVRAVDVSWGGSVAGTIFTASLDRKNARVYDFRVTDDGFTHVMKNKSFVSCKVEVVREVDEDGEPDIWSDANEADRRLLGDDGRDPVNQGPDDTPEPRCDGGRDVEYVHTVNARDLSVGDAVRLSHADVVVTRLEPFDEDDAPAIDNREFGYMRIGGKHTKPGHVSGVSAARNAEAVARGDFFDTDRTSIPERAIDIRAGFVTCDKCDDVVDADAGPWASISVSPHGSNDRDDSFAVSLCGGCAGDVAEATGHDRDRVDDKPEVVTDGGQDVRKKSSAIDQTEGGDRVTVEYTHRDDGDARFEGDVVDTNPARDPGRTHASITVDTDGGERYRVMFGGAVDRRKGDGFVSVGYFADVTVQEPVTDGGVGVDDTDDDRDIRVALSIYGDVDTDAVAVTVEDDPDTIASAIDRAHRHGYVVDESRDATDDVRPVRRRLRFVRADESDFDPEPDAPEVVTDGGTPTCEACDRDDLTRLPEDDNRGTFRCEWCGAFVDEDGRLPRCDDKRCPKCQGPVAYGVLKDARKGIRGHLCVGECDDRRIVRPEDADPVAADGGTFADRPPQSDEEVASGIVASTKGDTIDVWADVDGTRTVVSGIVASHGKHDDTHVVAFDTFGSTPERKAVRFTRRFTPDDTAVVVDPVLFDPRRADTFTVDRVERR